VTRCLNWLAPTVTPSCGPRNRRTMPRATQFTCGLCPLPRASCWRRTEAATAPNSPQATSLSYASWRKIAIGDGPTQSVWNQTGRSRSLPLAFMEWRRPEWYDSAACRGKTDLFSSQHDTSKAKAICATCPVIVQCAEVAEDFGVWAGTSERDRRRGSGRRNALVLVAA
jgi:Transcription factor WhiB